MNKNLFSSVISPVIIGLPIVISIIIFPTIIFPSTNWLINNHLVAIQQWLIHFRELTDSVYPTVIKNKNKILCWVKPYMKEHIVDDFIDMCF